MASNPVAMAWNLMAMASHLVASEHMLMADAFSQFKPTPWSHKTMLQNRVLVSPSCFVLSWCRIFTSLWRSNKDPECMCVCV